MHPRISLRGFVRRSVGLSVHRSVRGSVTRFSNIAEIKTMGQNIREQQIQVNSSKFKQIQENSFILTYSGRIFVRIELVLMSPNQHIANVPCFLSCDSKFSSYFPAAISFFEHVNLLYSCLSEYCTDCSSMNGPHQR